MKISLQSDFRSFVFPSGTEPHLVYQGPDINRGLESARFNKEKVVIDFTARLVNSYDCFSLFIAIDFLKNAAKDAEIRLILPYIPFARQDRWTTPADAFPLKTFARILNSYNLKEVVTVDAHSDVSTALIDNITNYDNYYVLNSALLLTGYEFDHTQKKNKIWIVAPDVGASKKIFKLVEKYNAENDNRIDLNRIVVASKDRDPATGRLSNANVPIQDFGGEPVIVVDDLCDGGGTFLNLAKVLKTRNTGPLTLAVTHGLFTKGIEIILDDFEKIVTTNSVFTYSSPKYTNKCVDKVRVVDIEHFIK